VTATRLMTLDDAPAVAELLRVNRDFLAPWEPVRGDQYFTAEGQQAVIRDALDGHERGSTVPHVVLDDEGRVIGRITLNGIVRGAFRSCSLGYWVDAGANGRGHATRAVREIVRVAFEELELHRVQAETLLDNERSQRVLDRNGFKRYGMAPEYLAIAGRWQACFLYQLVNSSLPAS
jgi:ribosomal-protein-alanine N-acetyltransferase